MRFLLDTHVFLWTLAGAGQVGPQVRQQTLDPRNQVFVSAASVWEAEIKRALGKLHTWDDLEVGLRQAQCRPLSITPADAVAAGRLPRHHDDPFDRMLVAQARANGLTLVTADRRLKRYDVAILDARTG